MPGADLTRKKVRDNFKSLLLGPTGDGLTDALKQVFTARINKSFIEELPAIFITTPSDTPILTRKAETNFNRKLTIMVEIIVAENDESQVIQDIADIIAGQVEDIILPNMFLQDPPPPANRYVIPVPPEAGPVIVNTIQLTDTQMIKTDDIKEDTFGVAMEFTADYYYCRATLQNLQDFNRFGHDYVVNGSDPAKNLTEIPTPP